VLTSLLDEGGFDDFVAEPTIKSTFSFFSKNRQIRLVKGKKISYPSPVMWDMAADNGRKTMTCTRTSVFSPFS